MPLAPVPEPLAGGILNLGLSSPGSPSLLPRGRCGTGELV